LAELALGVLPEPVAAPIREHLEGCESCRAEYETMVGAARLLPFAADEIEPPAAVRSGLMERIATEPRPLRRRVIPAWQRFTAIAAAAAVLIAAGGFAGYLVTRDDSSGLKAENGRQRELVEHVAQGDARRDTAEQGGAKAALVYAPNSTSAFAWVEGMPALPAGKAYQAWFIADGAPQPSTVFSSGQGGVWLSSPGDVAKFAAMAFTIEDDGGAQKPSQAPFMVVTLNTAASRPFTIADWFALVMRD
jgi:hypothetical protein